MFEDKKTIIGVVLIALTVVFLVVKWQDYKKTSSFNSPDSQYCYDGGLKKGTALLFDISIPMWDRAQRRGIQTYLKNLYHLHLYPNERVRLFATVLDRESALPEPSMSLCRPPKTPTELKKLSGQEESQGYFDNHNHFTEVFDTEYWDEIMKVLDLDGYPPNKTESPILEAIQALGKLQIITGEKLRHVVLVTDSVQNAAGLHFCQVRGHLPSFERFRNTPTFARLAPEGLDGVKITILFLVRYGYQMPGTRHEFCSEAELGQFWKDYFVHVTGNKPEFIRLRQESVPGQ